MRVCMQTHKDTRMYAHGCRHAIWHAHVQKHTGSTSTRTGRQARTRACTHKNTRSYMHAWSHKQAHECTQRGMQEPRTLFNVSSHLSNLSNVPYWSSPPLGYTFLRQRGPNRSSRHSFATTASFPDMRTPLNSLNISASNGALEVKIGVVSGRNSCKDRM